jgi:hypothetical protein
LLFRIVFAFVHPDTLASLDPVPKSIFDFGSIKGCSNSLHLSKRLDIVIGMETSEFVL